MEIGEAVTTDYREFDPETRVSKLMGAFKSGGDDALLVTDDDGVVGIVTRKQIVSSRHDPDEKARNVLRDDVPEIDTGDDIREVARLLVETQLDVFPVYEGRELVGVVTAESVAAAVEPFLDALDVSDVYSRDLRSVAPETTIGEVIHRLRTNGISRVPVIDETGDPVGMISYYDLLDFAVRATEQEQGGDVDGFDGHGGEGSSQGYRSHGGRGERAGEASRLLDLPARDVMNSPVAVTGPATSLDEAVNEMLDDGYSSLVVEVPTEGVDGVVTLTDVLRSLTWEPDEELRLQVFGMQHLTDMTREEIAELVGEIDGKYEEMDVIEAYVILHRHKERLRGSPLIQATIRLFTDKGRFAGTGEEYGAAPAIRAARDRLERTVLDGKDEEMAERRGTRDPERQQRLLGWWLEA
jgi:CBS domain-containing protein